MPFQKLNHRQFEPARQGYLTAPFRLAVLLMVVFGLLWSNLGGSLPNNNQVVAQAAAQPVPTSQPTASKPRDAISSTWKWQNPLPQGNTLNAVTCPADDTCYAAGINGTIVARQANSNAGWQVQTTGLTQTLNTIACTSPASCVAGGNNGTLLRTNNSGQTWTVQPISATTNLQNLNCFITGICYLNDNAGHIFKSTDQGASWASVYYSTSNTTGLSCPVDNVCYSLQTSILSKSTDGGQTWIGQSVNITYSALAKSFHSITCPSTDICYAVHDIQGSPNQDDPKIIKTSDGGSSWSISFSRFLSPTFVNLYCSNPNSCYALPKDGNIFETTDGGVNWLLENPYFDIYQTHYYGINCHNNTTCYVTGEGGIIAKTIDSRQNWQNELRGVFGAWQDVDCFDTSTCYVTANEPATPITTYDNPITNNLASLIKTSDGGTNWGNQTRLEGVVFKQLSCVDSLSCYVTTDGPASLYKTTNGGQSWVSYTNGITTGLSAINCPSTLICYSTAITNGVVFKTIDGGQNWSSQSITNVNFNVIKCPAVDVCYAGGIGIYKTTNGGQTWNYLPHSQDGESNYAVQSLSCTSSTTCYAMRFSAPSVFCRITPTWKYCGAFISTSDGGNSWNIQGFSAFSYVDCPGQLECYATGDYGTIRHTRDGGSSWVTETLPYANYFSKISCPQTCTAIGGDYAIVSNHATLNCAPNVVTQATDNGQDQCGSLSYALADAAQATTPTYTISFQGVTTITLSGALPMVTGTAAIQIEGGCQAGAPQVRIVPGPATTQLVGLKLGNNVTVDGLALSGFTQYGVEVNGNGNNLSCSYIGVLPSNPISGTTGAVQAGVHLIGAGNRLSGNVISGNAGYGLLIEAGSKNNQATGNLIGVLPGNSPGTFIVQLNRRGAVKINPGGQLRFGPGNYLHS